MMLATARRVATAATLSHLHQLKLMVHSRLETAELVVTVETLVLAATAETAVLEQLVVTLALVDQVETELLVVLAELFEQDELTHGAA